MDSTKLISSVGKIWDESALSALSKFISIPCKSPLFDPEWQEHGYFDKAANLFIDWAKNQNIPGLKTEIIKIPGKTPLLFIEVPGSIDKTVLFYGHMDKMPETEGWDEGLGPWIPVLKHEKLYGRGGADDGYAALLPLVAIKALHEQNIPYPKCIIIVECTEEIGSPDFPPYLEEIKKRIGEPDLVFGLDSGGENYDQLWLTSSLRGLINGVLNIEILDSGVHSGIGSGVVASTFRIARQLLSRIEDEKTGEILISDFLVDIPKDRKQQIKEVAAIIGDHIYKQLPLKGNILPISNDPVELITNQTWKPYLEIIGARGIPILTQAGNVLRAQTELKLSIRIPPMVDPKRLAAKLKEVLEKDPPYNAKVEYIMDQCAPGWNAPAFEPGLEKTIDQMSKTYYGKGVIYHGMGGSIGVIDMMNTAFPKASFIITGVLGPESKEHSANESLCVVTVKKLTCCVAGILAEFSNKK